MPRQTRVFLDAIRGASPAADGEDGRAAVALSPVAEQGLRERRTLEL